MLCMYVFRYNQVSQSFQLSFLAWTDGASGLGLIGINCWNVFRRRFRIAIGGGKPRNVERNGDNHHWGFPARDGEFGYGQFL